MQGLSLRLSLTVRSVADFIFIPSSNQKPRRSGQQCILNGRRPCGVDIKKANPETQKSGSADILSRSHCSENIPPGGPGKHVYDDYPGVPWIYTLDTILLHFHNLHASTLAKMDGPFHPQPEVVDSWPAPNYDNLESRGKGVLVISIIFPFLCLVVVSLRLYTRIWIKGAPGLDDVLIALALVCQGILSDHTLL